MSDIRFTTAIHTHNRDDGVFETRCVWETPYRPTDAELIEHLRERKKICALLKPIGSKIENSCH